MANTLRQGDEFSKFADIVRRLGYNDYDKLRLGTVISVNPLVITIDGLSEPLDSDFLVVAEHLTAHERQVTVSRPGEPSYTATIGYSGALTEGDRVICMSANGGQLYVIIDKVGGGG